MSISLILQDLKKMEDDARAKALSEGNSVEEADKIAKKESSDAGWTVVTAISRSTAWALAGATVGSVVPVVGTVIGGAVGFVAGSVSALTDPNPSPVKAATSWISIFKKF